MADWLSKINKNSHYQKDVKKVRQTAPTKNRKHLKNRTVPVKVDTYKRIKIYSAKHDMQMVQIVDRSVRYCLDHHTL